MYRWCRPTQQISVQCWADHCWFNRLRRWPNTNPSLGLLYTLRKNVALTQCCLNVDPQSLTLARQWNSLGWLYCVIWQHAGDYTGDAFHAGARNTRKHDTLAQFWCNAGPLCATLGQHYSNQKPLSSNHYFQLWKYIFSEHFLKTKVLNLRTLNVILHMTSNKH